MAEKHTEDQAKTANSTPSAGAVLWDGVKLGLSEAADMASLRLKVASLERKRDSLYTKLGRVTYMKRHPVQGTVSAELDEQVNALTAELYDVMAELTNLRIKIKLKRAVK